jgi:hypothetical protein
MWCRNRQAFAVTLTLPPAPLHQPTWHGACRHPDTTQHGTFTMDLIDRQLGIHAQALTCGPRGCR